MTEFKTLADVTAVLEKLIPTAFIASRDYKVQRMEQLLQALGNPEHKLHVIHIAGTSGKTSTSYFISAALRETGYKVGLTVSPHVDSVKERIQINGKPLQDEDFCRYFSEVHPVLTKLETQPTYFEFITALAYWVFAKEKVDHAVIEVGLGGRTDPTNAMQAKDKVCVITDIGLDHTELLGDTLDKIAYEKGCIIKENNQVFMYEQAPEVMTVIDGIVAEKHADLRLIDEPKRGDAPAYLPLFQQRNWYLAVQVVEGMLQKKLNDEQKAQIAKTIVPARMELFQDGAEAVIMDGAHNGQKMKAFVGSVSEKYPDQRAVVLAAFVEAGNPRAFEALDELLPITERLILTAFSGKQDTPKRSINPDILADYVKTRGFTDVEVAKDPAAAYKLLLADKNKLKLVTGSFFLMNHIRPLMKGL